MQTKVISFKKEFLNDGEDVIIYGTCIGGELVLEGLKHIGITPTYFCDGLKNIEKYCGIPVISPSKLNEYKNSHILIAATRGFQSISEYLNKIGCIKYYDICDILKYIDESSVKKYPRALSKEHLIETYRFYSEKSLKLQKQQIKMLFLNFIITEKCSLKCKKCIELMPYYKEPKNYSVENIKKPLEKFFECVDSISELQVVGGEPFMNKNLYKFLYLLYENEKVKKITVVSNATIIPSKKNIDALKHKKVKLVLDDYGYLSKKLNDLIEIAKREGIDYCVEKPDIWQDCGELKKRNYDKKKVSELFKECTQRYCLTFLKGKLFRCPYSAHSINLQATPDDKSDYVDFNNSILSKEELQKQVKKLIDEKEYLSACLYCSAINPNSKGIKPAEQTDKTLIYTKHDEYV